MYAAHIVIYDIIHNSVALKEKRSRFQSEVGLDWCPMKKILSIPTRLRQTWSLAFQKLNLFTTFLVLFWYVGTTAVMLAVIFLVLNQSYQMENERPFLKNTYYIYIIICSLQTQIFYCSSKLSFSHITIKNKLDPITDSIYKQKDESLNRWCGQSGGLNLQSHSLRSKNKQTSKQITQGAE